MPLLRRLGRGGAVENDSAVLDFGDAVAALLDRLAVDLHHVIVGHPAALLAGSSGRSSARLGLLAERGDDRGLAGAPAGSVA